jgi:hypothetical protein
VSLAVLFVRESLERYEFLKRVRVSLTVSSAARPIVAVTNDSTSEFACRML